MTPFFFMKPDGIRPEVLSELFDLLDDRKLTVKKFREIRLHESQVDELYPKYSERHRPFTVFLLRCYLSNHPLLYGEVSGDHGTTIDALLSIKREIRQKWGNRIYHNIMHCPQTAAEAELQLSVLFEPSIPLHKTSNLTNRDWNGLPLGKIHLAIDRFLRNIDTIDHAITDNSGQMKCGAFLRCTLSWKCTWEDILTALIVGTKNTPPDCSRLLLDSFRALYAPQGLFLDPCQYATKAVKGALAGRYGWSIRGDSTP